MVTKCLRLCALFLFVTLNACGGRVLGTENQPCVPLYTVCVDDGHRPMSCVRKEPPLLYKHHRVYQVEVKRVEEAGLCTDFTTIYLEWDDSKN